VPVGFLERNLVHGDYSVTTSQIGRFFYWGGAAAPPYQTSVTLDPIIQKSIDSIIPCTG
jgi:hypothetical protein